MMLLIYITLIAMLVMARRRPRRRRWTSDMRKVPIFHTLSLSTLATLTVLNANALTTSDNEYRVLSATMTWSLAGLTAGEGPLIFGYAHGDYSVTEIKEALEAENTIDRGDKVAAEQGNRLVRRVGSFSGLGTETEFNDGKPMRMRLNWVIAEGRTLNYWVYNFSGGTLTDGSAVIVMGDAVIKYL